MNYGFYLGIITAMASCTFSIFIILKRTNDLLVEIKSKFKD